MMNQLILLSLATLTLGSSPHSRIVGGEDADINDYPWQVSIEVKGMHVCGGTIISDNFVVTTAYCTNLYTATDLVVLYNTSILGAPGKRVNVAKILQHPKFTYLRLDYDISFLKLNASIELGIGVQAVGLPDKDSAEIAAGSKVTATGWGALTEGGPSGSVFSQLQAVEVEIRDRKDCEFDYIGYSFTQRMICAGVANGGKDICAGDMGGPLVANGTLYGLASWGIGCGRQDYPGVYTNILPLRNFITECTGL